MAARHSTFPEHTHDVARVAAGSLTPSATSIFAQDSFTKSEPRSLQAVNPQ
jgi:hypothetical protein